MSPLTARVLPTLFQDRCGVSLYDAQYSDKGGKKGPIPDDVIQEVLIALHRFKRSCQDFSVSDVRIVATEATREAINSVEYRQKIKDETGWKVEMLTKEEEGRIGAVGVASSFSSIKGLVMDLGGGSIQLTWMIADNGNVETCRHGAVSLPYGAAAMKRLLNETEARGEAAREDLQQLTIGNFRKAIHDLEIPSSIREAAKSQGGLALYLSGGGFRRWGYILMATHPIQPYPIPIINGFQVTASAFLPDENAQSTANDNSTFRISSRRASQIPAVSFLVTALVEALPTISTIHFAQGGLREGLLYCNLPPSLRSQHPLVTASAPYAPPSTETLAHLLASGMPTGPPSKHRTSFPDFILDKDILTSIIHLLNVHAPLPKDIRAGAALRSTTTGVLGSAHGLAHKDRAFLALTLCERWGGELSATDDEFFIKMQELVGGYEAWWAKYVGCLAGGIGDIYPAGVVREGEERVRFAASTGETKEGKPIVEIQVSLNEKSGLQLPDWAHALEKLGKKKNWIGGRDGWGLKVELEFKTLTEADPASK